MINPVCRPSVERCLHCTIPVGECTGEARISHKNAGFFLDKSESAAMRCGENPKWKPLKKQASVPFLKGTFGDCGRVGSKMRSVGLVTWCSAMLE